MSQLRSSIKSDKCDPPSALNNKRFNVMHAGKLLQGTPRSKISNSKTENVSDGGTPEEPAFKHGQDTQDEPPCLTVKKRKKKSPHRHSSTPASAKMGNANPEAFIQGMHGYQWTDADLAFVYQAKQQKQVQQLQQELKEVQETLQAETLRLEQAIAARDKIHSEIFKTLSRELLVQMFKDALLCSGSSDQLEVLSNTFLQNTLKLQDGHHAVHDANDEVVHSEKELVKAEELRDKDETIIKEIENCQLKHEMTEEDLKEPQIEPEISKSPTTDVQEIPNAVGHREEKDKRMKDASTSQVKAPEVARVPGRARNAPKKVKPSTVLTKAVLSDDSVQKEAGFKESSLRGKTPQENVAMKMVPNETAPASKGARKRNQKEIALKETMPMNKHKAPKVTTLKEEVPEEMVLKENSFKKKAVKNTSQAKVSGSSNTTQARGRAKKAAEIPKPQLDSDSEIIRRSKRIARKNQRETLPQ